MSKSTYPAQRNLQPYASPHRETLTRSLWYSPHSRLRRAMRIEKRRLRRFLATTPPDLLDAIGALQDPGAVLR